jgi:hypothetical protein
MFFLFGWGHQTTADDGEAVPVHCYNCNNDVYWHLVHTRKWFTLFFIPVFPYETTHAFLCPICTSGKHLNGSDEVQKARTLVTTTASFKAQALTEETYLAEIRATGLV